VPQASVELATFRSGGGCSYGAYARTREPDFPDPLVVSGSCYRWYSHEVLAYIDSRRSEKRAYLRRDPPPEARDPLAMNESPLRNRA